MHAVSVRATWSNSSRLAGITVAHMNLLAEQNLSHVNCCCCFEKLKLSMQRHCVAWPKTVWKLVSNLQPMFSKLA